VSEKSKEEAVDRLDETLKRLERKYGEHVDRPTLLLVSAILLAAKAI
jgi:hypothetical protein